MEYLRFRYIFSKLAELVKWQKNDFTNYILRKALVNQRFICSMANWDWIGLFMVSENVTGTVCWHLRKWMKFFPKSVKHLANVVCMSCELLLRPVWELTLTCLIKWTPPLQTLPLMIYLNLRVVSTFVAVQPQLRQLYTFHCDWVTKIKVSHIILVTYNNTVTKTKTFREHLESIHNYCNVFFYNVDDDMFEQVNCQLPSFANTFHTPLLCHVLQLNCTLVHTFDVWMIVVCIQKHF